MKNIILLGSKDSGDKNDVTAMAAHLKGLLSNAQVTTVYLEDLAMVIKSGSQKVFSVESGKDLRDADQIIAFNWYKPVTMNIYKDFAFAIALYLEKHKVKFWNSEMLSQRSISKLSTTMQLSLLGLPVPDTYFCLNADKLLELVETTPFIFKSAVASRGADNYLCQSVADAKKHAPQAAPNYFIAQSFVQNDADLRVICFGGKPKLVIERRRQSNDSHLNNSSQGAKTKILEATDLPAKVIEDCGRICYNMGREMAGIDIIPSKDKPGDHIYLEVNAIPQLTSGAFIEEKMKKLAQSLNEDKDN